jgi:hypothetical protein
MDPSAEHRTSAETEALRRVLHIQPHRPPGSQLDRRDVRLSRRPDRRARRLVRPLALGAAGAREALRGLLTCFARELCLEVGVRGNGTAET